MSTTRNASAKAVSAAGLARSGREDRRHDLAHVAAKQLLDVGVEQQHDQEDAADDRHAEEQLQRRLRR